MSQITIEKLVQGGQGLARVGDKVVFVWGALPGEVVEYQIFKNKSRYAEAVATKILVPSPFRINPRDTHYLCCAPWQSLAIAEEQIWKVAIAQETYKKIGGLAFDNLTMVSSSEEYEYRRKMEFGFATNQSGQPMLAVRERDSDRVVAIETCALARPEIMGAAQFILQQLRLAQMTTNNLSGLILRMSERGEVIARLIVKNISVSLPVFQLGAGLIGLEVTALHREQVPLATYGHMECNVTLGGVVLASGIDSFFQINVPVFEVALADIKRYIEPQATVLDYYGGVGAIGLYVADKAKQVTIVEISQAAVAFAKRNILNNNLLNAKAECQTGVVARSLITADSTVIVDPPRTGLEPELLDRLVEVVPERIIYVSCDVATQARDLKRLSSCYKIGFSQLYNFFPHTPHTEALIVLFRV